MAADTDDVTRTANKSAEEPALPQPPPQRLVAPLQVRDPERYDILGEHGRGGLGKVTRAHDKELGRHVAIKELINRGDVGEVRFLREALITARLEHPGIVPIHEAGRWPDGTPFYVMKLVAGRSLKELLAERKTVDQRIELLHHVVAVADAVAYAHKRKIIHRDLKPANVIVGDFGETVVIDWGLAKDLSQEDETAPEPGPYRGSAVTDLTETGTVLGTPTYMAPEQFRGEAVDQRADVFAIGALLWEVCSTSKVPPADPVHRDRLLRRAGIEKDLGAIVAKALSPEPAQRYRDAGELAMDLKAFISGARIAARRYSLLGVVAHWIRRHRALAITIMCGIVLATVGAAISIYNIANARARAEHANAELVLENAELLMTRDPTAVVAALASYRGTNTLRKERLLAEAHGRGVAESVIQQHNERIWFLAGDESGAIFTLGADRQIRVTQNRVTSTLVDDVGPDLAHSYSQQGRLLAYVTARGRIALLDLETRAVSTIGTSTPRLMKLSRDGSRLAMTDEQNVLVVWSLAPQVVEIYRRPSFEATYFVFESPDQIVAIAEHGLKSISLSDGEEVRTANRPLLVDASPRGRVAVGYRDGSVALLSPELTTLATISGCTAGIASVKLAAADSQVLYVCSDGVIGVLRFEQAANTFSIRDSCALGAAVAKVRVDDTGRWIVVATKTNAVYVYDTWTRAVTKREGQAVAVNAVAAPTAGFQHVLTGDLNGTVRVWRLPVDAARTVYRGPTSIHSLAIAGDDRSVIVNGQDGVIRSIDLSNGLVAEVGSHPEAVYGVRVSRDSLLSYGVDGSVRVWNRGLRRVFDKHGAVNDVAVYDAQRVVSAGDDGRVFMWSMNGQEETLLFKHFGALGELEVLRGSGHVVVTDRAGAIWDIGPRRVVVNVRKSDGAALILRASSDGRWLAAGGSDGRVALYDTQSWTIVKSLSMGRRIRQIAYDPKGRDVVVASESGVVSAVALGDEPALLWREFPAQARDVAYHPSGDIVAFVCADGGAWFYSRLDRRWVYARDHEVDTFDGEFTRDGKLFISADYRGVVTARNVAIAVSVEK